jgi:hypothetical protein
MRSCAGAVKGKEEEQINIAKSINLNFSLIAHHLFQQNEYSVI